MSERFMTPGWEARNDLESKVSLIIVHTNDTHDPDEVSRIPVQKIIDSGVADYIYEFMAYHSSFVKHDGEIIDCKKRPGYYPMEDVEGGEFIIAGGGVDWCHFNAYSSVLVTRFGRKTRVHLPADAIYMTEEKYEGGDSYLVSEIVGRTEEFKRYENLARIEFEEGAGIWNDFELAEGREDARFELRIWSNSDSMIDNIVKHGTERRRIGR
jgi:hypothetical protein